MQKQKWWALTASLFVFVLVPAAATPSAAHASSVFGITARPQRVTFEPAAPNAATRVKIEGSIGVTSPLSDFAPLVCGYLYYGCAPGEEPLCREQWQDIAAAAETGQCVLFGARRGPTGAVLDNGRARPLDEAPSAPDMFVAALGLGVMSIACGSEFSVACALPATGVGGGGGGSGSGGVGGTSPTSSGGSAPPASGGGGGTSPTSSGGSVVSASGGGGGTSPTSSGGSTPATTGSGGVVAHVDASADAPPAKKGANGGGCALAPSTPTGAALGVGLGLLLAGVARRRGGGRSW